MKAEEKKLFEYIRSSDNYFIIPPYQRTYHWDISDIKRLIDDVKEYILKPKIEQNIWKQYYLGNLIVKRNMNNDSLILIDGQQRITTCVLISKVLYYYIKKLDTNKEHENLLVELKSVYFLSEKDKKIKLNNISDLSILEAIIQESHIENSENNFVKNYDYLMKYFKNYNLEMMIAYTQSFLKLTCAVIQLDKDENEHLIFESINSKGKKLLQSDLIKNYIFFISQDEEDISNYYNNKFLKNFSCANEELEFFRLFDCCLGNKAPESKNGTKIYESFKNKYKDKNFTKDDMNDIKRFHAIYKKVKNLSISPSCLYIVKCSFVTYFPWIYSVIKHYKSDDMFIENENGFEFNLTKLLEEQLKENFKIMSTYDVLRIFGGFHRTESTKSLHKFFDEMQKHFKDANLNEISVKDKLSFFNDKGHIKAYTIPKDLNENIFSMDMYMESSRLKVILWLYEMKNRETEKMNFEQFSKMFSTVEHIFPQGADKNIEWKNELGNFFDDTSKKCNTIGNLTLLDKQANGYNSNDVFGKKKKVFSDSYLRINKIISEYEEWNLDSIRDRANKIKKFITNELIVDLESN